MAKLRNTEKALSYLKRKGIKYLDVLKLRQDGRYRKFIYYGEDEAPDGEALVDVLSALKYYKEHRPTREEFLKRSSDPKIKKVASILKSKIPTSPAMTDEGIAKVFNKIRDYPKKWTKYDVADMRRKGTPNPTRR